VSPAQVLLFLGAMAASLLPHRLWPRLPAAFHMGPAAFGSGVITLFAGLAIGLPGFLEHAHATTSLGLDAELHKVFSDPNAGYSQGMVQGFSALSIFTFLLLTPKGWITMYCVAGGVLRMAAAWFDDPIGDPILTGVDAVLFARRTKRRERRERETRLALEGPELPDRLVSGHSAGIADCDFVIVSSRRKAGWDYGTVLITADACYRVGEPVEQTIAGHLRTLYPLTEHKDFEAFRRPVRYELPPR
jgi:hypothetical protein